MVPKEILPMLKEFNQNINFQLISHNIRKIERCKYIILRLRQNADFLTSYAITNGKKNKFVLIFEGVKIV